MCAMNERESGVGGKIMRISKKFQYWGKRLLEKFLFTIGIRGKCR